MELASEKDHSDFASGLVVRSSAPRVNRLIDAPVDLSLSDAVESAGSLLVLSPSNAMDSLSFLPPLKLANPLNSLIQSPKEVAFDPQATSSSCSTLSSFSIS